MLRDSRERSKVNDRMKDFMSNWDERVDNVRLYENDQFTMNSEISFHLLQLIDISLTMNSEFSTLVHWQSPVDQYDTWISNVQRLIFFQYGK